MDLSHVTAMKTEDWCAKNSLGTRLSCELIAFLPHNDWDTTTFGTLRRPLHNHDHGAEFSMQAHHSHFMHCNDRRSDQSTISRNMVHEIRQSPYGPRTFHLYERGETWLLIFVGLL